MKDIISSLKTIVQTDRKVFIAMIALFLVSLILSSIALASIHPSNLPIWFRYANFGENYYNDRWYYLFVFVFEGVVLGILHNLIAVKLYSRKGKQISILFLFASMLVVTISVIILLRIIGINAEIS